MLNATLLSLEEVQEKGLLERPIEIVRARPDDNPDSFAVEAQRLLLEEKVDVIFGCWSSASRKAVLPVLDRHRGLLFYPLQYEGLESSPHVVYTGAVPNQQLVPAVKWALDNLGKRVFLVGSDYIYPHTAHTIAKDQIKVLNGQVVGEEYLLLGTQKVEAVVDKIEASQPDFILNTINGTTNQAFFTALHQAGITTPTMSMSMTENEYHLLGKALPVGHFASWSYFQSVDSAENKAFIERYRQRFGSEHTLSSPMESAYFGVKLWAQAVKDADSSNPDQVKRRIGHQSLAAPEGIVSIDPASHHTWKMVRVGKLNEHSEFEVVWSSAGPVRPRPYPSYRSQQQWDNMVDHLYKQWNGHWVNPEKP